jgi:transposase-like protein
MNKTMRYSPEVRERAVRLVIEHQADYDSQWAARGGTLLTKWAFHTL